MKFLFKFFLLFIPLLLIFCLFSTKNIKAQSCSGESVSWSFQNYQPSFNGISCDCNGYTHYDSSTCSSVYGGCYNGIKPDCQCNLGDCSKTCPPAVLESCDVGPDPTITPGGPTITPGGGGGGCIGLGGSCLSNQNGCCPGTGCQTTSGLPGYGTCFDDGGQGSCSFAACSGNACTDHYYNPDPARGGCYKSDDGQCNVPNGCLTPNPTQPPTTCSVSAPSQTTVGTIFDVAMTKNESGGAVLCSQPTIGPSADCTQSGSFTYCFDTDGCDGRVKAKGTGTCTVRFYCNNNAITCSSSTTIINPSPTPWINVQVHKTNGANQRVSQICRVSCTNSTCTVDNSTCSSNDADFTFPKTGIVNKKGGRITLVSNTGNDLVVLGITPSVDGKYESTCNSLGGACYGWGGGTWTTGGRTVTFVVATPTPTLTPTLTLTPTVAPWKKISNASFQSDDSLNQDFPTTVVSYDGDDTNDRLFAVNNSGATTVSSSSLAASELNQNGWYNQSDPDVVLNKNAFLSYAKARKKMTTLTTLSGDLSEITGDGIYYYDSNGAPLTITTNYSTQTNDFVLVVDGSVVFNVAGNTFNADTSVATRPARRSIAILADSIAFSSGANFLRNANAIFVASTIDTGSLADAPLKVKGNIITSNFTNGRTNGNNQSPSVFVVFDGKQYVDLLPLLSVSKYDWKQLQ